jgi:hypothetical protein
MPFIQENGCSHGRTPNHGADGAFQELVQKLSDILGPCSGLDSEEIDPDVIQQTMRSYSSKGSEWEQYALLDPSKHYTRNLVDEGNGKSNLVGLIKFSVEMILICPTAHLGLDSGQRQPYS